MKAGRHIKIIIGIVGILVVGFIGFQVLKVQSPDVEKPQKVKCHRLFRPQFRKFNPSFAARIP